MWAGPHRPLRRLIEGHRKEEGAGTTVRRDEGRWSALAVAIVWQDQRAGAGAAGHADVEEDDVHQIVAGEFNGLFAVLNRVHAEVILENHPQRMARALLVVDHEHGPILPWIGTPGKDPN